jgi:hypothetical protein
MNVNFEGRTWEFDQNTITVLQGIAMHLAYGLTIKGLLLGIQEMDPRAIQCDYWLMLQQNGVTRPIKECEFDAIAFLAALGDARQAEEAPEEAAAEAEVPTSLPPGEAPSPESATPTGTTLPHRGREHPVTTG